MSKERILVVDDEEDILELVRYNLASEGYKIICAASGVVRIPSLRPWITVFVSCLAVTGCPDASSPPS